MTTTQAAPVIHPVIAIVGRPNVGKSTLFNRLVGRRSSLVRDVPGVTRDRLYGQVSFERWQATLIDTGGFDPSATETLIVGVRQQVLAAVEEADLVIFVVDARAGITALDAEIARLLRRAKRPVVLVASKVDAAGQESAVADLYTLGFGDPVPVSAEHGRGIAEMLEVVRARAPLEDTPKFSGAAVHVAVIGRPNVGKSSLVNALVGDERVLVHDQPGTTRDAVDTAIVRDGKPYVLVDTAGIRRKGRVSEPLEKLAVVMALKGLERAHVAVLVIDASEGVAAQDAHIVGYAHEAGRALVLAVNKWDLVGSATRKSEITAIIRDRLPFVEYAPVVFTSATEREGLDDLFRVIDRVAAESRKRVSTQDATEVLREAMNRRPTSVRGEPLTLHSAQQVAAGPPTFVLRVSAPDDVHFSYERYLVKSIRHTLGFEGSPVRLSFRKAPRPRRAARHGGR
ncbi:MAG: ribosome biogenesis GTPase Der [Candidatus Rokubacteria bacterium]|nr:ribosome biogenesis GTPase Der [Candidatus Rokubacteria bacterium]